MDQFLKALRHRRAIIQQRIEEEQTRPQPDSLKLRALKKVRLRFREQIEFIDRLNRRGEAITIPVITRRRCVPSAARLQDRNLCT